MTTTVAKRGPGAPKGNMNALRGGGSSQQFQLIAALLMQHPDIVNAGAVPGIVRRLLPEVIRLDRGARANAEERVRQIMAPFQPQRDVERLAHLLLMAIATDSERRRQRHPKRQAAEDQGGELEGCASAKLSIAKSERE